MQRLGPFHFKRLITNHRDCLQNSATISRLIDHCKYCAPCNLQKYRHLTVSAIGAKFNNSKIEAKIYPSQSSDFLKCAQPLRVLKTGEIKSYSTSWTDQRQRFPREDEAKEDRYRQKWSSRDNKNQAGRTYQKFGNKDREIEDRYQHGYASNKRYTARPLESVREESQEIFNGEVADAEADEGNVFGRIRGHSFNKSPVELGSKYDDEPDSDGEEWVQPRGRRNKPYWFGTQMKKLCKEGKLKEAIEMLQIRMLKEERVKPIAYNYNILIGACGRAGYTKMAFNLYNDMKKRGIPAVDVTYTALINACAESPWPTTDGIDRLRKLHGQLQDKKVRPNLITNHALMKAYAKCGDIQMTFDLFRHHLASTPYVTAETFSFFFFACASNGEAGLTYAIQGWRYLQQRKIQPDIYLYNLLLRVTRDCGIGDHEVANRVLLQRGQSQELLALPPPLPPPRKKKNTKGLLPDKEYQRVDIFPIKAVLEENTEPESEFYDSDDGDKQAGNHKFWWEEEQLGLKRGSNDQGWIRDGMSSNDHTRSTRDGWASNDHARSTRDGMSSNDHARGTRDRWSSNDHAHSTRDGMSASNLSRPEVSNRGQLASSDVSSPNVPASAQKNFLVPNLLNASGKDLEQVISLGNITTRQDRIALIGGCHGVLDNMKTDGVKPDIKTFGLLSELIFGNTKDETELMVAMDTAGVKGDIDFYNGLIGARATRRDVEGAKEILSQLGSKGLFPSLKTFGNLAKGCYKAQDGMELLENMKTAGRKPNVFIFSSLIGAANKTKDYGYLVKLLPLMQEYDVQPNEWLLNKLENIASFHKKIDTDVKNTRKEKKDVNFFRKYYIPWLDKVKMAEQVHPWDKLKPDKYQGPRHRDRDE